MDSVNTVPGVDGSTYGVKVDMKLGDVTVGDLQLISGDIPTTRMFAHAYRLGREHKKMQIRTALSI
jgi:hypothetical protein